MKVGKKKWRVDYSIRYTTGEVTSMATFIHADDTMQLAARANERIIEPARKNNEVRDAVIWNMVMLDRNVF